MAKPGMPSHKMGLDVAAGLLLGPNRDREGPRRRCGARLPLMQNADVKNNYHCVQPRASRSVTPAEFDDLDQKVHLGSFFSQEPPKVLLAGQGIQKPKVAVRPRPSIPICTTSEPWEFAACGQCPRRSSEDGPKPSR